MTAPRQATTPRKTTLDKYGLTVDDFTEILNSQYGVCAICGRKPNGRWNIDHYHCKGWSKKPPEERKKYVRGILCWVCNRYYAGRGITVERATNLVRYLTQFERRIAP